MAWNRGVILGSNPGSGGGGGAPSGAAGGELAGTYPNPTVKDAVIDDANIVAGGLTNAALAAAAGIVNTKLATNPLARANHTGTQLLATISDAGTLAALSAIASAQITDGTIVDGDISAAAAIAESKLASSGGAYRIGPRAYANIYPGIWLNQSAQQATGDARYVRVVMSETGQLRDVSFYIATANAGTGKLFVMDTGQANGTHTTCTVLAYANQSMAATGWVTLDANIAVVKGDTLYFCISNPDTTSKFATTGALVAAGVTLMPNTSFLTSSGAGTTTQKLSGHILSANVPTAVAGTVTDANMGNSPATTPGVVWRYS